MVTRETDEGREYISEWRESPPPLPCSNNYVSNESPPKYRMCDHIWIWIDNRVEISII